MEKISLGQYFPKNCDNQNPKLLKPFKKEVHENEKKIIKKISIKCKKNNRISILKLEILEYIANSTKNEEEPLSMGLVYALDENENLLDQIGWF